ncbi:hypothetical protein [Palleronia pontilimi]|nr:hypothetical protein [Palleronia pontilimi]
MTFYEFSLPLVFIGLAWIGVQYIRYEERKLDRKLAEQRNHPSK